MTNTELFPPLDSFELVPDFPELAVPDANGIKVTEQPLDWDGPDDKDDPHNWPIWKKVFHSAIPAIYSFGLYVPVYNSHIRPHLICIVPLEFPRLWPRSPSSCDNSKSREKWHFFPLLCIL